MYRYRYGSGLSPASDEMVRALRPSVSRWREVQQAALTEQGILMPVPLPARHSKPKGGCGRGSKSTGCPSRDRAMHLLVETEPRLREGFVAAGSERFGL